MTPLPPPPALLRCRRPPPLERLAARNNDPKQAWGFDVRVTEAAIELISDSPASLARARGQRPPLPHQLAAFIPAIVGTLQSALVFRGGGGRGGGMWNLAMLLPVAAGVAVTALILAFVFPGRDGGLFGIVRRPVLRFDRASRTLRIACSGAAIPIVHVRGVHLLHGIADTPTGNYDLRQLAVLTHIPEQGWRRYLAHVDFCPFIEEHARAVHAFGAAFDPPLAADIYRIRGWRTPESYLYLPGHSIRMRAADTITQPEAATPEPLGNGQTLDAWRAAGCQSFDSTPERVHPAAHQPMCLRCRYSLEGLNDPKTCPECGADFVANPTLRA